MLKRLVIINSEIYAKADIELDGCDSLQIVGPNNIGKSTLIYALNFLYIISEKQMTFSGYRKGDKTTINHYFPNFNLSYIVFEIFKHRYYCILVKKSIEGNLVYYRIDSQYKEDYFFEPNKEGHKRIKNFDEVCTTLAVKGINYEKFSHKVAVFNFVYQKGKKSNGVVWIDARVSQGTKGISNNFSKIYKYLINSKLIDNQTLKEALMIADNREEEHVAFKKKSQKDIQTLIKLNEGIKTVQRIQKRFEKFKEILNLYTGKGQILSELVFGFDYLYVREHTLLNENAVKYKKNSEAYGHKLNNELNPASTKLNQKIGEFRFVIKQDEAKIKAKEQEIKEIKSFEPLGFLKEKHYQLEKERRDIESQITLIENQNLSSEVIEQKIDKITKQIRANTSQIENYSNQLIHQISTNQADKERINLLLSQKFATLSKDNIIKPVSNVGELMNFFDGIIKLPNDLEGLPITSIEELQEEVEQLRKEKAINEGLLPIAQNLEKHRHKIREINTKIKTANEKIEKTNSLPSLNKKLAEYALNMEQSKKSQTEKEKELTLVEKEKTNVIKELQNIEKEGVEIASRIKLIQQWKIDIEESGIKPIEYTTKESLEMVYKKFKSIFEERKESGRNKNALFEKLKSETYSSLGDEYEFVRYIETEIRTLDDKRRSIEGLLKSIATQFANPCRRLYSRYEEFKTFVTNRFNSKIKKITISDIDSLSIELVENEKLVSDLKKIMAIRGSTLDLFDNQSTNLQLLNKYLDNESVVKFKDLFDIKLHLEKKGRHKVVDLKKQIESDGTDRMIRLVLVMAIINRLVINDEENKIVLFVDEIGTIDEANRLEILRVCKEHNFIPISAAPLHPYDGFDKYYIIRKNEGKIIVSKENGNVIERTTNVAVKE